MDEFDLNFFDIIKCNFNSNYDDIVQEALISLLENLPQFQFNVLGKTFLINDKEKQLNLLQYFIDYMIDNEDYELIDDIKKIKENLLNEN